MTLKPTLSRTPDRPSWRAITLFLGSLLFAGSAIFLLATV